MDAIGWIAIVVVVVGGLVFLGFLGGRRSDGEFIFKLGPFEFEAKASGRSPLPGASIKNSESKAGGAEAKAAGEAEMDGVTAYGDLRVEGGAGSTGETTDPKAGT